jgi:hypothetical protein
MLESHQRKSRAIIDAALNTPKRFIGYHPQGQGVVLSHEEERLPIDIRAFLQIEQPFV